MLTSSSNSNNLGVFSVKLASSTSILRCDSGATDLAYQNK